jgi:glutathione S-transferase
MTAAIDLYSFIPFDRGSRVRWLANELGIEITEHRLDARAGEHRGEVYRKVNPTGLVPAIVREGVTQFDSAAICLALAEAHREAGLAVFEGEPGRAEFLSWYFFAASTLDAATYPLLVYKLFQPDEAMLEASVQRLMPHLAVIDRRMMDRDWICGRFTIADILVGHGLALQHRCGVDFAEYPALAEYHARLRVRPAASGLFQH